MIGLEIAGFIGVIASSLSNTYIVVIYILQSNLLLFKMIGAAAWHVAAQIIMVY